MSLDPSMQHIIDEFVSQNKSRWEIITSFQDQINHITKDSYQSVVGYVKNNKDVFFKNKESSSTFFSCLFHFSLYNYKQLELILDLAKEFLTEMNDTNFTDVDMILICSRFLNSINYLFYTKVISIESIMKLSKKSDTLFINFYPEINEVDHEYAIKKSQKIMKNGREELKKFLIEVISNCEQHIIYRNINYHPSKLHKAIRDDDIELFQSILSQNNYSINRKIEHSFYERTSTCDLNVSLIQIAAVYGSIKVFKFLWMQKDIYLDENLQFYSYSGRNYEIIHICEEKCPFANVIDFAISTHQNDLVNYFLDNFEDKIKNDQIIDQIEDDENPYKKLNYESIQTAVYSLNYEIIVPCLKKIVYFVKNIDMTNNFLIRLLNEGKRTFLECAPFDMELFKFLYNLDAKAYKNISINLYYHIAFIGAYEAIKFMLNNCDKNQCFNSFGFFLINYPIIANYILDIYDENKNEEYLKSLKSHLDLSTIADSFNNYDEDVFLRLIKTTGLFVDDKYYNYASQKFILNESLLHLPSNMIISFCQKVSTILEKSKFDKIIDFYIKNITNDETRKELIKIKNL